MQTDTFDEVSKYSTILSILRIRCLFSDPPATQIRPELSYPEFLWSSEHFFSIFLAPRVASLYSEFVGVAQVRERKAREWHSKLVK